MAHFNYLEPKQYNLKIIYDFLTNNWDSYCIIIYRKNSDKRIYKLSLKQEHDCISYNLYRMDGPYYSYIKGTPFRHCQNEDFFEKLNFFTTNDDIISIGFYNKDFSNFIDFKLEELKKVFPDALIQKETIDWDDYPDITTIPYQKLLSLIQSYKNTGKDIYFDKIKKLFGY